jgi:hypothetical protein
MKSTFFKPLTLLFILILTVSCSTDSEENLEQLDLLSITQEIIKQQATENSVPSTSRSQNCADPNLLVVDGDHNFYYIYIEYDPSSPKKTRNAIRDPYCNRMVSITPCETNPNAEIWYVRGKCPAYMDCRPDIVPPTDPDLRVSMLANTCQ